MITKVKVDLKVAANGWLIIDKPLNITSTDVVRKIKQFYGLSRVVKVGHAGTLDPMATGVLPIAVGEATKVVNFVMDKEKSYSVYIKWGESTNTDDSEGVLTGVSHIFPRKTDIIKILPEFTGTISQVPPDFSAIKIEGKRAYSLARENKKVSLEARHVSIKSIELIEVGPNWARFFINCGRGTYIRALARDMAKALGTLGHVSALRRTQVGCFSHKASISLDNIETLGHSAARLGLLLPVDTALADIPALELTSTQAIRLMNGQPVAGTFEEKGLLRAKLGNRLVAIAEFDGNLIRPTRVFNN